MSLTSAAVRVSDLTNASWLILYKEIITVYSKNHVKHMKVLCGKNTEFLFNVKAGDMYSYHCALKR
jgi:hypothetical protein